MFASDSPVTIADVLSIPIRTKSRLLFVMYRVLVYYIAVYLLMIYFLPRSAFLNAPTYLITWANIGNPAPLHIGGCLWETAL